MQVDEVNIEEVIDNIEKILGDLQREEDKFKLQLPELDEVYRISALNLLHYTKLREHDISMLQRQLRHFGLTGFSHSEGHVKWSLKRCLNILHCLTGASHVGEENERLTINEAKKLLNHNTRYLLGESSHKRRVRIMVTQPAEAATNTELIKGMLKSGMDCVRINCAHDNPQIWKQIIDSVKNEAGKQGKNIMVAMDLGGPKIRTGAVKAGARVIKFRPKKDSCGMVIEPAEIVLVADTPLRKEGEIPLPLSFIRELLPGDEIQFTDCRGRKRKLLIAEVNKDTVRARCNKVCYIGSGNKAVLKRDESKIAEVGELPPSEGVVLLRTGDMLLLTKENTPGESAAYDGNGQLLSLPHISCQFKGIFDKVKPGELVLFDDGALEGRIRELTAEGLKIEITRAKENGFPLKAEKGINFPESDLMIKGLTQTDIKDLEFIAEHADIVNFSFVSRKEDVEELISELDRLGVRNKLGIILKIETRAGFDNLKDILFSAMKTNNFGVMIARGDLAVETGWNYVGMVQEEILSLCGAAHIPVIWATQVLENMAKKGLPSRSEITDVTASLKSECVMLNKGPYINDAISMLDTILRQMEVYRAKNEKMLPRFLFY